jgi:hypothetical protein
MKNTLYESSRYKTFINDRNKALEQINLHTQTDISRLLFESLDRITGFVSHMAIQDQMSLNQLTFLTSQLNQYIEHQFQPLLYQMEKRLLRMRKATFILTYLSELEAIARATQRTKPMNSMDFNQKVHEQLKSELITGHVWLKRIWLALSRLKQSIIKNFQTSIAREDTPKAVVDSVKAAYPPIKAYRKPPRALKPIREADKKPKDPNEPDDQEFDFYSNIVSDDDWNLVVQAYKDFDLPPSRFDNQKVYDEEAGYYRYDWEIEQDMTDDFVKQVRDGQVEAAQDLGVQDFVWVSVLDNKTCDECCLPRNGKTTSEIESMLKSGELDKTICDAVVPPSHPNCRCDIAPVASTDEVQGPDWKSFQDWLDS